MGQGACGGSHAVGHPSSSSSAPRRGADLREPPGRLCPPLGTVVVTDHLLRHLAASLWAAPGRPSLQSPGRHPAVPHRPPRHRREPLAHDPRPALRLGARRHGRVFTAWGADLLPASGDTLAVPHAGQARHRGPARPRGLLSRWVWPRGPRPILRRGSRGVGRAAVTVRRRPRGRGGTSAFWGCARPRGALRHPSRRGCGRGGLHLPSRIRGRYCSSCLQSNPGLSCIQWSAPAEVRLFRTAPCRRRSLRSPRWQDGHAAPRSATRAGSGARMDRDLGPAPGPCRGRRRHYPADPAWSAATGRKPSR